MDLVTNRAEETALYGYEDLNRVEAAVEAIGKECKAMGLQFNPKTKTDWALPENFTQDSWPVHSQMVRYLNNVAQIKRIFYCAVPLPASMDRLNWISANNIEKVLEIAMGRIDGIKKSYRYSGELIAGEEIV